METQLRLADRRGLLSGAELSSVQQFGCELMLVLEQQERLQSLRLQQAIAGLGGPDDDDEASGAASGPSEPSVEWVPPTEETASVIESWLAEHSGTMRINGHELVNGGEFL